MKPTQNAQPANGKRVWHIARWATLYEPDPDKRRGRRSPLHYVKEHVYGDGETLCRQEIEQTRRAVVHKGGKELWAIWTWLKVAAAQRPSFRGYFLNHRNRPATCRQIAELIGVDLITPDEVKKALKALSAPDVGLLEHVPVSTLFDEYTVNAGRDNACGVWMYLADDGRILEVAAGVTREHALKWATPVKYEESGNCDFGECPDPQNSENDKQGRCAALRSARYITGNRNPGYRVTGTENPSGNGNGNANGGKPPDATGVANENPHDATGAANENPPPGHGHENGRQDEHSHAGTRAADPPAVGGNPATNAGAGGGSTASATPLNPPDSLPETREPREQEETAVRPETTNAGAGGGSADDAAPSAPPDSQLPADRPPPAIELCKQAEAFATLVIHRLDFRSLKRTSHRGHFSECRAIGNCWRNAVDALYAAGLDDIEIQEFARRRLSHADSLGKNSTWAVEARATGQDAWSKLCKDCKVEPTHPQADLVVNETRRVRIWMSQTRKTAAKYAEQGTIELPI